MALKKLFYLTKEGLRAIREEFRRLEDERSLLVASGEEGREDLLVIERRLRDISEILSSHAVIRPPLPRDRDEVRLGATVLARATTTGRLHEVRLVGTAEANPVLGKISDESPFGRALLGKKVGDEIFLLARPDFRYVIEKISYHSA